MNNTSIFTADRMTHLKIVALSLVCATVITAIGVAARGADGTIRGSRIEATVIRVGAAVTAATSDIIIR